LAGGEGTGAFSSSLRNRVLRGPLPHSLARQLARSTGKIDGCRGGKWDVFKHFLTTTLWVALYEPRRGRSETLCLQRWQKYLRLRSKDSFLREMACARQSPRSFRPTVLACRILSRCRRCLESINHLPADMIPTQVRASATELWPEPRSQSKPTAVASGCTVL
jgi:hypothetical protein